MKAIQDIIQDLTDESKSLNSALLKTKVLVYKVGNNAVTNWLNSELNGYDDDKSIPEYRIIASSLIGTVSNGFQRGTNIPLPILNLDKELQENLTVMKLGHSASSLEFFVRDTKTEQMVYRIPPEFFSLLSRNLGNNYHVEYATKEVYKNQVVDILSAIRSKLLEFILQLDKEFPNEEISVSQNERVEQIFVGTIIGDNNVVMAGHHNVQTSNITNLRGNLNELKSLLASNDVHATDIAELEKVLKTEIPDPIKKELGPKANNWIKNMLGKALDGTWKISVAVAAKLLPDLIANYYGLKL